MGPHGPARTTAAIAANQPRAQRKRLRGPPGPTGRGENMQAIPETSQTVFTTHPGYKMHGRDWTGEIRIIPLPHMPEPRLSEEQWAQGFNDTFPHFIDHGTCSQPNGNRTRQHYTRPGRRQGRRRHSGCKGCSVPSTERHKRTGQARHSKDIGPRHHLLAPKLPRNPEILQEEQPGRTVEIPQPVQRLRTPGWNSPCWAPA